MVFIPTEEAYLKLKASLNSAVPQCLVDIFDKNWDAYRETWAYLPTENLLPFETLTNNNVESRYQKLMTLFKPTLNLSVCLRTLIEFQQKHERLRLHF